jgi:hypothetical protein
MDEELKRLIFNFQSLPFKLLNFTIRTDLYPVNSIKENCVSEINKLSQQILKNLNWIEFECYSCLNIKNLNTFYNQLYNIITKKFKIIEYLNNIEAIQDWECNDFINEAIQQFKHIRWIVEAFKKDLFAQKIFRYDKPQRFMEKCGADNFQSLNNGGLQRTG